MSSSDLSLEKAAEPVAECESVCVPKLKGRKRKVQAKKLDEEPLVLRPAVEEERPKPVFYEAPKQQQQEPELVVDDRDLLIFVSGTVVGVIGAVLVRSIRDWL